MWILGVRERDVSFRAGSIGRFAKKHGITMDFTPVQSSPVRDPRQRDDRSRHYIVRLIRPNREFTTPFSMGFGIPGPPTLDMVITSMVWDALNMDESQRDFIEYADQWGIDPDDPWEQRHFLDFIKMMDDFKAFLGPKAYEELLHDVPEARER